MRGKREGLITAVLVSLMIMIPPIHTSSHRLVKTHNVDPPSNRLTVVDNGNQSAITWTSDENTVPAPLDNRSIVQGNRIKVAFDGMLGTNVTDISNTTSTLEWGILEDMIVNSSQDAKVTLDVPQLHHNITGLLTFTSQNESGFAQTVVISNVTFLNTFSPIVENVTVTGEGKLMTISWTLRDGNPHDTHTIDIRLSNDGGVTYVLMDTVWNTTNHEWDSTAFMELHYTVKVTAFDETGLFGTSTSEPFLAGTSHGHPVPQVNHPPDVWIYEGETGRTLKWNLTSLSGLPVYYRISVNNTAIDEGEWNTGDGPIAAMLDGLAEGVHVFAIRAWHSGVASTRDVVTVHVFARPMSILDGAILGIGFGAVIVVCSAMLIKIRRRGTSL